MPLAVGLGVAGLLAVGVGAAAAQPWRGPVTLGVEVRDADGNPLAGAEVRLEFADVEPYVGPPVLTTDVSGRAEVFGLAEGLWRVMVMREGFSRNQMIVRLDPKKKKVLVIAGPLRDPVGAPLEVEFFKSESQVAHRGHEGRTDRREERKKERRKKKASGERISESGPEAPPEPRPQPPMRSVPPASRPAEPEPVQSAKPEPVVAEPEPQPGPMEPEAMEPRPEPPKPMEPKPGQPTAPEPSAAPAPMQPPASPAAEPRRERDMEKPMQLEPEAGPPPAVSRVRSYQAGDCSDCKPGEAATSALSTAGKGSGGGCPAGFLSAADDALQRLAKAMTRSDYNGPLVIDGQVVAAAPEPARSAAQRALAPYVKTDSPCRLLAVALAPSVRFTGYRYEARQGSRGGDCLAGQDCPIGGARWPDHPVIRRTAHATLIYSLFENRTDAPRVAEMTVYFDPTP